MLFLPALSISDIVAFAAVFIAICSLGATIWQGWISHSHNRKSVRPMLVWGLESTIDDKGMTLRFSIKNNGTGPAIVKELFFKINGDVIAPVVGGDYVRDVAAMAIGNRFRYVLRRHGLPRIESAIPAGAEFVVAELEFPGGDDKMIRAVYESTNIIFSLRYESLYEEQRTLIS